MILDRAPQSFQWRYTNAPVPAFPPGVSVTPGASDGEGSWTEIATAASITEDVYMTQIMVIGGSGSAVSNMHLLDIGIDPAGGTSYTPLVENMGIGCAGGYTALPITLSLPVYIPAGSSIAARIQGRNATPVPVRIVLNCFGLPSRTGIVQKLQRAETLGTITATTGPVMTPGVSSAEGNWLEVGTTTFPWRFVLPTFQLDDASSNIQEIQLDVAYGDDTNKTILVEHIRFVVSNTSEIMGGLIAQLLPDLWCDVPSGARIFARASTSIATADSNYTVLVTGLG